MDESLQLTLQQRLQQGLSPLQVQYVKMLEMNGPEIEEEVRRAVDENPALEEVESRDDYSFDAGADSPAYYRTYQWASDRDTFPEGQIEGEGETLISSLSDQLGELNLDPEETLISNYVIGNLDSNGYLRRSVDSIVDDLAFTVGLETTSQKVRHVLDLVRSLDPAGVGAIDLRDCLLLQLQRLEGDSEPLRLAKTIVTDYYDLFSKMHFDRLQSALGISQEQLRKAMDLIRSLNPKPGAVVGADVERHVTPDFNVNVDGDGNLHLSLYNNIPELGIERTFAEDDKIVGDSDPAGKAASAKLFLRQKRDEAANFIKMLQMRQKTLFNVMSAILKIQHDFFLSEDPADLRPMILKDVAALTGYDLSVISRATAGKYVSTQRGMYPLKYFFNERPLVDDADLSLHKILEAIKDLVAKEDPKAPLSDEAITSAMHQRGFDIARRTVTKYRERLSIPVARLRKKL